MHFMVGIRIKALLQCTLSNIQPKFNLLSVPLSGLQQSTMQVYRKVQVEHQKSPVPKTSIMKMQTPFRMVGVTLPQEPGGKLTEIPKQSQGQCGLHIQFVCQERNPNCNKKIVPSLVYKHSTIHVTIIIPSTVTLFVVIVSLSNSTRCVVNHS